MVRAGEPLRPPASPWEASCKDGGNVGHVLALLICFSELERQVVLICGILWLQAGYWRVNPTLSKQCGAHGAFFFT